MPSTVKRRKLVRGVGINDADYSVMKTVDGIKVRCPFYQTWWLMLDRCYSEKLHDTHPTYSECSVVAEWLYFSKFRSWMINQDWKGKQLDKDILLYGNKQYGPDTCVFVTRAVNMFMIGREDLERVLPQGVKLTQDNTYSAQVKWKGKGVHIGTYKTLEQASAAYINKKKELAVVLSNEQEDLRVKNAILSRFNGGGHWTEVVEDALKRNAE